MLISCQLSLSSQLVYIFSCPGLTDEEIETAQTQAVQVATTTVSLPPPRPIPVQVSREYTWRQIAVGSVFIGGFVGVIVYWIKV